MWKFTKQYKCGVETVMVIPGCRGSLPWAPSPADPGLVYVDEAAPSPSPAAQLSTPHPSLWKPPGTLILGWD